MTRLTRRIIAVAVTAAAMTMLFSSLPLGAQEPKAPQSDSKSKAKGKKTSDPTRRVPAYFGQIGLTDTQRESIFKVQGKHQPKIDALQKQIDSIRAQMMEECEGLLTSSQKKLLEERRAAAAEARAKKGAAPAKASD
jgi:Spy/CpxP family protein refolding chaperone